MKKYFFEITYESYLFAFPFIWPSLVPRLSGDREKKEHGNDVGGQPLWGQLSRPAGPNLHLKTPTSSMSPWCPDGAHISLQSPAARKLRRAIIAKLTPTRRRKKKGKRKNISSGDLHRRILLLGNGSPKKNWRVHIVLLFWANWNGKNYAKNCLLVVVLLSS